MRKIFIVVALLSIFSIINYCNADMPKDDTVYCEIVHKESMKKGGSLKPFVVPPKYTLVVARVFIEAKELNEDKIRKSLNQIIEDIRQQDDPDAISIFAFKTKEGAEMAGPFSLAKAEWWPKGHTLSPDNDENIRSRKFYEITYDILKQKETPPETIVSRLTKEKRKEIYYELIKSEDRANAEAEKMYPINTDNIPMNKLSTYDWAGMGEKNMNKSEELRQKYEKQIMRKHKLTKEEINKIKTEALVDRWPLPDLYYSY